MTDPKNQTNQTNTTDAALPPVDDYATATEALREKLADAQTPGYQAEFDPEEAERAGAFVEDALSEQDATSAATTTIGTSSGSAGSAPSRRRSHPSTYVRGRLTRRGT